MVLQRGIVIAAGRESPSQGAMVLQRGIVIAAGRDSGSNGITKGHSDCSRKRFREQWYYKEA